MEIEFDRLRKVCSNGVIGRCAHHDVIVSNGKSILCTEDACPLNKSNDTYYLDAVYGVVK